MRKRAITAPAIAEPGDLVEIYWDGTKTKRAIFVKYTRTGTIVVRLEGVDRKWQPTGVFGSDRGFQGHSLIRIIEKKYQQRNTPLAGEP